MDKLEIHARPREVLGKRVKALRRQGILPANLFGHGESSEPLQVDTKEAEQLLSRMEGAAVVELRSNGGKPRTVLLKHVQRHPVHGTLLHLDFQQVSMAEEVKVAVPIHLVGEAPVAKTFNAALVQSLNSVEITARASDLPSHLEADISGIADFHAAVHVRDIQVPPGVQILHDLDDTVVTAVPSAAAMEEARLAAEAEATAAEGAEAAAEAGEEVAEEPQVAVEAAEKSEQAGEEQAEKE